MSDSKKWNWVSRDKILKMLSRTKALQKIVYRDFVRISIRGQLNEPRNVAMYLMRHLRGDTLSTICKEFGLKKDSSAGSIVDRVKKQILKDKQFRNKVAGVKKIINKS